jgi:hypothetical protein
VSILTQILAERNEADIRTLNREAWETVKDVKRGLARVTDLARDGAVRCWRVVEPGIAEVATLKNGVWTECRKAFPTN